MSATLRYRGERNNKIIELAKNLDAFKKVPDKYTETSEIGGTLSLISRLLIIFLIYKEVRYYQEAKLIYKFTVDTDMDTQVLMHVDITVAMPCKSLSGVDLMDETQQDVFAYGTLQREDVWFEMTPEDRQNFERAQHMNSFLREEYHSIQDILWKDIIKSNEVHDRHTIDKFGEQNSHEPDACRLHGSLTLNKVAGVLHLVGGAQPVIDLFGDHFLIEFRRAASNFSHRINRLSFGHYSKRLVHTLEGDETILKDEAMTVQYFLKIVPTEIHNIFSTINTYQYAVSVNMRKLDSSQNSYGSPGIYFKYDWSALKISVSTDRDNLIQLIIRLSSIIAGIIVISGILNVLLLGIQSFIVRHLAPQLLYNPLKPIDTYTLPKATKAAGLSFSKSVSVMSTAATTTSTNDLINTANKMSYVVSKVPKATLLPVTTASSH